MRDYRACFRARGVGGDWRPLRCWTPASAEPLETDSRRAAPPVRWPPWAVQPARPCRLRRASLKRLRDKLRRGRSGLDRDGEARVTGPDPATRRRPKTSRTCTVTSAARSLLASDSVDRRRSPSHTACVTGLSRRRPTEELQRWGPRGSPGHRPRLGASRRVLPGKPSGSPGGQVTVPRAGRPSRPG